MTDTATAYAHCLALAQQHYENFPVASRLVPAQYRPTIAAIYAFARTADDFADEGDDDNPTRLARLEAYESRLTQLETGNTGNDPVFVALGDSISRYRLPVSLLHDLLSAFRQDVTVKRYARYEDVLDYCRRSANPVGRLLLHMLKQATPPNLERADAICTSLQVINFMQDVSVDFSRGRIYIPQDEMARFDVSEEDIGNRRFSTQWQALMDFQLQRQQQLMYHGAPLARALPGRFGLEMRLTVAGGLAILNKLRQQNLTQFTARPRLGPADWVKMAASLIYYPYS